MPLSANLVVVALITIVLAFWTASWRASRRPGARAMVLSLAFLDLALVIGPIETITGRPPGLREPLARSCRGPGKPRGLCSTRHASTTAVEGVRICRTTRAAPRPQWTSCLDGG